MEEVFLKRVKQNNVQTTGQLFYRGVQVAVTLELGWNGNKNRVSCIPVGKYEVVRRKSAKYGEHFHILNVPSRSYILIHHANYYYDLLGCIGVGESFAYINKDAHLDITSSRKTMQKLLKDLPETFILNISNI
jgi:hypothetical protein